MKRRVAYALPAAVALGLGFVAMTVVAGMRVDERIIDASTPLRMAASLERVRAPLSDSRRAAFDEAVSLVIAERHQGGQSARPINEPLNNEDTQLGTLNGQTVEQVIEAAEIIETARKQRQRVRDLEELAALKDKARALTKAREALSQFRVLDSRFSVVERGDWGRQPTIQVFVENGTDAHVTRAYFKGALVDPDTGESFFEGTFDYQISGGLEPGNRDGWSIGPSIRSGWARTQIPDNAVFSVTAEKLHGPGGETLYATNGFGEHEAKRLTQLEQQYRNLESKDEEATDRYWGRAEHEKAAYYSQTTPRKHRTD